MINGPVFPGDHFVFYGLLKQGASGAPEHIDLEGAGAFLGACRFEGVMHDLGGFPGVMPGTAACHGMLYRLDDTGIVAAMDAFEGIDPDDHLKSLYRRQQVPLLDIAGAPSGQLAWCYIYNQSTDGHPVIRDGTWPLDKGRPRK